MKRKLFLMLCVCLAMAMQAQEELVVSNPKPGKISAQIKKECYSTLKKLKIVGLLNNKDLNVLTNLSCLEELDLSEADFMSSDYKPGTPAYYNEKQFWCLPIPSLQHFIMSHEYYKLDYNKSFPNLKHLTLSDIIYLNPLESGSISVEKVTVVPSRKQEFYFERNYKFDIHRDYLNLNRSKLNSSYDKKFELDKKMGNTIQTKVLELPSKLDLLTENGKTDIHSLSEVIFPNFIKCVEDNLTILNQWDDSFDLKMLNDVDSLAIGAFANCNFTEFTLPEKFKIIPMFCFANCKNLNTVELKGVEDIGDFAFAGTAMEMFTIPSTVTKFSFKAFDNSNIKNVKFVTNKAPMIYETMCSNYNFYYSQHCRIQNDKLHFSIPRGTADAYKEGAWQYITPRQY